MLFLSVVAHPRVLEWTEQCKLESDMEEFSMERAMDRSIKFDKSDEIDFDEIEFDDALLLYDGP